MIKTTEFRIGNYIKVDDNGIIRDVCPSLIDEKYITAYEDSFFSESIYGITLTEEWFIKFGFIKPYKYYLLDCGGFVLAYEQVKNEFGIYTEGSPYFNSLPHIKCVHQLQNLHFALTGEELIIQ